MDVKEMGLKMKKIKSNRQEIFGRIPRKTDHKKFRIINISDNIKINHNIPSISNPINQTTINKIDHLKGNGLMYSNILKFR